MRPSLALPLLLALASAAAAEDVTGTWAGSAKLTNDWPKTSCQYVGTASPPSVTLDLAADGSRGTVTMDISAAVGSACPALHKRYDVQGLAISGSSAVFRDAAGHEWTLALRTDTLEGIVAWKESTAGGGEPLAQGFSVGGNVLMTRLSGEVALKRTTPTAGAAPGAGAAPAAGGAPVAASGSFLGGVVGIIGANIVGVGGILLANHALQDNKGTTTNTNTTCSLRNCILPAPGDCNCNNDTATSGQSCGSVPGGVALNGLCLPPAQPCQSQLSCNNGICQDQAALCPF